MQSKQNNQIVLIKTVLALIVILVHCSILSQNENIYFLQKILDSTIAVKSFFMLSGYLVMGSYVNSPDILSYIKKRFMRIFPAYVFAIILCLFIGLLVTNLNMKDFILNQKTHRYIISNFVFLNFIQPDLPGVFEENSVSTLNGSLWTIKIELALYALLPIIFYMFTKFGSTRVTITIFLLSLIWSVYFEYFYWPHDNGIRISQQFPGAIRYFILGNFYFIEEKKFQWNAKKFLALFVMLKLLKNNLLKIALEPFILLFILWLGNKKIVTRKKKIHDISYGMYLYHFPIIQVFIYYGIFNYSSLIGVLSSLFVTMGIAIFSSKYIESQ
jgi:peptidoglycan/LPS O-acetylase OafA/YrhL